MQRRHAARSGRMPSGDGWFHAMQNAHVIKDAEIRARASAPRRYIARDGE